jgi:uncharacterized membrane protein YcjF (UPF0283 family)
VVFVECPTLQLIVRQVPQIWDEYCSGDPEVIRLQRLKDFQAANEKRKAAQAEARKVREAEKAAATQNAKKSGRKRKKTARAQVRYTYTRRPHGR